MTVPLNNSPWIAYTANGSQAQFAIPWLFFLNSDIEVYSYGALRTDYTVAGAGMPGGGSITFYANPSAGTVIFLRRVTARQQLLDYQANDAFGAEANEAALDRLTLLVQDLMEELSRRPALAIQTPQSLRNLLLPAPTSLKLVGYNANATAFTLFDPGIVQVTLDVTSGIARGKNTQTLTADPGSLAPLVAATLIPAGVRCLGVTYRPLVTFSNENNLTGGDLGGMGLPAGWGENLPRTLGYASGPGAFTRGDTPIAVSAEDVTLTPRGGSWGATGSAKVTAHWETYGPDA